MSRTRDASVVMKMCWQLNTNSDLDGVKRSTRVQEHQKYQVSAISAAQDTRTEKSSLPAVSWSVRHLKLVQKITLVQVDDQLFCNYLLQEL